MARTPAGTRATSLDKQAPKHICHLSHDELGHYGRLSTGLLQETKICSILKSGTISVEETQYSFQNTSSDESDIQRTVHRDIFL